MKITAEKAVRGTNTQTVSDSQQPIKTLSGICEHTEFQPRSEALSAVPPEGKRERARERGWLNVISAFCPQVTPCCLATSATKTSEWRRADTERLAQAFSSRYLLTLYTFWHLCRFSKAIIQYKGQQFISYFDFSAFPVKLSSELATSHDITWF